MMSFRIARMTSPDIPENIMAREYGPPLAIRRPASTNHIMVGRNTKRIEKISFISG